MDIPPPEDQSPKAKLVRNIREIGRRIIRGTAAGENRSVSWHFILRIVSIILSSLGSVGVIVDKASNNLPGEVGWAFWGSVILLIFGVLSQIANEFQIAQLAMDSRSLAERSALCETQLENILIVEDPRQPVVDLLIAISNVFASEKYNRVLPRMTSEMERAAESLANSMVERYGGNWNLPKRPQRPKGKSGDDS